MNIIALLTVLAPFPLAAVLIAVASRRGELRWRPHQFRAAAPMSGLLDGLDADARRSQHEIDAIRTRFEHQPTWPGSGAGGAR